MMADGMKACRDYVGICVCLIIFALTLGCIVGIKFTSLSSDDDSQDDYGLSQSLIGSADEAIGLLQACI